MDANLKYISKLLNHEKGDFFVNYDKGIKLFEVFYNNNFIKENFKKYIKFESFKTTYDLFYKNKENLKFHSLSYRKDRFLMTLYRLYYGASSNDYADLGLEFNDFEIIKMKHMPEAITEKITKKYTNLMTKTFGIEYKKALEKYEDEANAKKIDYDYLGDYLRKSNVDEKALAK